MVLQATPFNTSIGVFRLICFLETCIRSTSKYRTLIFRNLLLQHQSFNTTIQKTKSNYFWHICIRSTRQPRQTNYPTYFLIQFLKLLNLVIYCVFRLIKRFLSYTNYLLLIQSYHKLVSTKIPFLVLRASEINNLLFQLPFCNRIGILQYDHPFHVANLKLPAWQ